MCSLTGPKGGARVFVSEAPDIGSEPGNFPREGQIRYLEEIRKINRLAENQRLSKTQATALRTGAISPL
jgi:hypothetical protein